MIIGELDMASVIGDLTIRVKYSKTTRARVWLGTRAMGIAARIFGCKVEIVADETDDTGAANFVPSPRFGQPPMYRHSLGVTPPSSGDD